MKQRKNLYNPKSLYCNLDRKRERERNKEESKMTQGTKDECCGLIMAQ